MFFVSTFEYIKSFPLSTEILSRLISFSITVLQIQSINQSINQWSHRIQYL